MFAHNSERRILLRATIIPRKYGRSVILERPYIPGNFVAATFFPGGEISCDTGHKCYEVGQK